jgi:hypothetical protein
MIGKTNLCHDRQAIGERTELFVPLEEETVLLLLEEGTGSSSELRDPPISDGLLRLEAAVLRSNWFLSRL